MFRSRNRGGLYPWVSLGDQIERLNSEFNRLFGRATYNEVGFPAFNIWNNAEGSVLTSELPGVKIDDIELTVTGSVVTIKGARKNALNEQDRYVRRERPEGEFVRTFELPFQIDAAKVSAKAKNGVLSIELPRAESDKPRKITVSAS